MLIWPADEIVLWCGTFFWGLGIATFYGSGISYASRLTNMSGKWFFMFGLGNSIGNLTMPVLGTALVFRYPHMTKIETNIVYLALTQTGI